MKILIAMGRTEPDFTTGKCLIRAFKELGHDVCTVGPLYGHTDLTQDITENQTELKADIDVSDKAYPETYTYKEILDQAPWTPDFVLQIEPHFYFVGDKPKDINSYYWVLDPHRGGVGHRNMAKAGSFTAIFIAQKFFVEPYARFADCYFIPQAVDLSRVDHDPKIEIECDIAFLGELGVKQDDIKFDKMDSEGFEYTNKLSKDLKMWSSYGEYAERFQLIANLAEYYDVRIYKKQSGQNYGKILQKGRIGFHRSLFNDIAIRVFETMVCKRALITDRVPFIDTLFQHEKNI